MCKKYLSSLVLGALVAASASSAFAVDTGTVTFNGKIVPDTCSIDVNGTDTNGEVNFLTVSTSAFQHTDGGVGDTQNFDIKLTGCPAAKLNLKFQGDRVSGSSDEVLTTTGTASHVGVRMYQADGTTAVKFDNSEPAASSDQTGDGAPDSTYTFSYVAKAVQVGSVDPTEGDYTAMATYTVVYH